ncbi:TonB-dependent receptor [Flavobacterium sp.]|uniref:SusC/RagA family TonB-linked outer membrane protein n=1 Tax=Flavobacterium sp. TaxID=239 RepID=UPI0025C441F2|nr:TonB-dependent receptor [Flavobacterium sp.]MBA4276333.1 TonB-dependent receptor [Flavobacterium sp.]
MRTNHRLFLYSNFLLPKREWLLALVVMLMATFSVSAQNEKIITGVVVSATDALPLPGVNIVVKGTSKTANTDFEGKFSIQASPDAVLVFSYIGFANQQVTVANQNNIKVSLKEDVNKLDEVVVIGYGTQKKSDLSGAVSVVNMESAKKAISYDIAKMIQGQAAGVTVQSSGEPGGFVNIKIRGNNSFGGGAPLFVIDGMIVEDPFDFAPGDVESMQVLKDASSAAIYGVRGANGVVIITTKKGKLGKLDVKYKSLVGFQNVAKKWDVTDRVGYQTITSAAEKNAGLTIAPGNDPTSSSYITNVDTNWQDEAYETGIVKNHSLSFNGGAETMAYNMNLDYFNNTSYIKSPQDYERLSMNMNLNGKKGIFKYGAKLGYTQSDKENFNSYVGETAIGALIGAVPTMPVYDANRLGGYGGTTNLTQRAISLNVIGFNNLIENNGQRNRFIGDIWGEIEIVKGLKYKIDASFDRLDYENRKYVPQSDLGWYYITTKEEASLDVSTGSIDKTIFNNILTYSLDIDKHKFDVLAGLVQERSDSYNHWSRGVGYDYGEISMLQYADDTSTGEGNSTITGKSYISRINYSYDDRYLLQANFRQDKTSRFSEINNAANNYSFSGAWKLSNEKFIHLPGWVSNVKLRASYGKLGNNTIAPYFFATTINSFAGYDFNNALAPGTTVVASLDPNVKWEDVKTSDVAVELGLFDNDLQFTAEYFIKNSTNLLVDVPLPFSTGAFPASIRTNAGAMKNTGFEFSTTYNNNKNEFKYSISANLGTLKNEVKQIGLNGNPIYGAASKTEVGRSMGEIYAYVTDGIFQNAAEIAAAPTQTNAGVGDIRFKDINGDGMISDLDRTYQGNTIPKYNYGLNFSASYKNWDFSMFWQGAGGNKVFNSIYRNLMSGQYGNHHTDMLNYWTPTNTNTDVPRPIIGDPNGNGRDSNRFIESGNYLKLQTLEIGYEIPVPTNSVIQKAKVFVNGQNLWTITKYIGTDPDFNSNDGLFSRGYDGGSFPNPRTVSLGLEVNF